jgi:hypothetical protein
VLRSYVGPIIVTAALLSSGMLRCGDTKTSPKRQPDDAARYKAIRRVRKTDTAAANDLEARSASLNLSRGLPCPDDNDCVSIWNSIEQLGERYEIRSTVKVETKKPGATIRYQTLAERATAGGAVRTMKHPTQCSEKVAIGSYYIWAERAGKPTSSRNDWFDIVDKRESVKLVER